jgi:O-methyltransferase
MSRYQIKRTLHPLRMMARRVCLLPTIEEQQYVSAKGCLYNAATFLTQNYVAGDYLEFGVFEGSSFIKAYHALRESREQHLDWLSRNRTNTSEYGHTSPEFELWRNWQPRFFAFDSFAGLPEVKDELHEAWTKGSFMCSEGRFKRNIAEEGVELKAVVTVPGFYDQSLTPDVKKRHNLRRAALVNIDCDLYESTIQVLDFLTDLLVQGSVIVFDDWFRYQCRSDQGQQRACREWLGRNPRLELIPHWNEPMPKSFIVNLKEL